MADTNLGAQKTPPPDSLLSGSSYSSAPLIIPEKSDITMAEDGATELGHVPTTVGDRRPPIAHDAPAPEDSGSFRAPEHTTADIGGSMTAQLVQGSAPMAVAMTKVDAVDAGRILPQAFSAHHEVAPVGGQPQSYEPPVATGAVPPNGVPISGILGPEPPKSDRCPIMGRTFRTPPRASFTPHNAPEFSLDVVLTPVQWASLPVYEYYSKLLDDEEKARSKHSYATIHRQLGELKTRVGTASTHQKELLTSNAQYFHESWKAEEKKAVHAYEYRRALIYNLCMDAVNRGSELASLDRVQPLLADSKDPATGATGNIPPPSVSQDIVTYVPQPQNLPDSMSSANSGSDLATLDKIQTSLADSKDPATGATRDTPLPGVSQDIVAHVPQPQNLPDSMSSANSGSDLATLDKIQRLLAGLKSPTTGATRDVLPSIPSASHSIVAHVPQPQNLPGSVSSTSTGTDGAVAFMPPVEKQPLLQPHPTSDQADKDGKDVTSATISSQPDLTSALSCPALLEHERHTQAEMWHDTLAFRPGVEGQGTMLDQTPESHNKTLSLPETNKRKRSDSTLVPSRLPKKVKYGVDGDKSIAPGMPAILPKSQAGTTDKKDSSTIRRVSTRAASKLADSRAVSSATGLITKNKKALASSTSRKPSPAAKASVSGQSKPPNRGNMKGWVMISDDSDSDDDDREDTPISWKRGLGPKESDKKFFARAQKLEKKL